MIAHGVGFSRGVSLNIVFGKDLARRFLKQRKHGKRAEEKADGKEKRKIRDRKPNGIIKDLRGEGGNAEASEYEAARHKEADKDRQHRQHRRLDKEFENEILFRNADRAQNADLSDAAHQRGAHDEIHAKAHQREKNGERNKTRHDVGHLLADQLVKDGVGR